MILTDFELRVYEPVHRSPRLVVSQRVPIVTLLGDFMSPQYDLVCLLTHCVGQHATLEHCDGDDQALGTLLASYYEPLELLAYELVSETRSNRQRCDTPINHMLLCSLTCFLLCLSLRMYSRLLLLCLATLTKFAARHLPLVPRVMLFFVKAIKSSNNEDVLVKARK